MTVRSWDKPFFPEDEHAPKRRTISTLTVHRVMRRTDDPTTATLLDHLDRSVFVGQVEPLDIHCVQTIPGVDGG